MIKPVMDKSFKAGTSRLRFNVGAGVNDAFLDAYNDHKLARKKERFANFLSWNAYFALVFAALTTFIPVTTAQAITVTAVGVSLRLERAGLPPIVDLNAYRKLAAAKVEG